MSPGVLEKMVYAGTQSRSFPQAERNLKHLAELDISEQRIARATKRIGQERVAAGEAEIAGWEKLSLPEQQGSPREQVPPLACVEMDGGRIQIWDRQEEEPSTEEVRKGRFWRETKVGCLLSMTMRSDEYRREGLPITSSHIESTIKQINRRVKGSEKFWSSGGADALRQLAADYLSDTQPLTTFWRERTNQATGQRHYHTAG